MTWQPSFRSAFDLANHKPSSHERLNNDSVKFHSDEKFTLFAIAFFLLLPVFFQMSNGVFKDSSIYFDSSGEIASLPIPLSIIICFAGIVLLGKLMKARLTMTAFLLTCLGMLASTVMLGVESGHIEKSKLVLLAQYLLPILSLVLGQQYGARPGAVDIMAKAFTLILLLAVPAQLTSTFAHGLNILSPSLFLFSAYQHLQYVPVVFVGAFLVSIFTLWESHAYRWPLSILAGLMGIYVSFSLSILAIGFLVSGLICFSGHCILLRKNGLYASIITSLTIFVLAFSVTLINADLLREKLGVYIPSKTSFNVGGVIFDVPSTVPLKADEMVRDSSSIGSLKTEEIVIDNLSTVPLKADEPVFDTPRNLADRAVYLKFYLSEIAQSSSSIFLGHHEPPNRNSYPSAHNYYLDFIYNFGGPAIIPLLGLAIFTLYSVIRNFIKIASSSKTLGLAGVVLFLLFVDNMFKVGMRQPYPGLMTFYLWGILLALLARFEEQRPSTDI
jgi:hypothetical protein